MIIFCFDSQEINYFILPLPDTHSAEMQHIWIVLSMSRCNHECIMCYPGALVFVLCLTINMCSNVQEFNWLVFCIVLYFHQLTFTLFINLVLDLWRIITIFLYPQFNKRFKTYRALYYKTYNSLAAERIYH